MADDTREPSRASTRPEPTPVSSPKRFPKGVVLGKDGKPCRSCTSFAEWASQTKKSTNTRSASTLAHPQSPFQSSVQNQAQAPPLPEDCPPDVEQLGRSSWTLLHTLSASYPTDPTPDDKRDMKSFLSLFAKLYPCWVCAEDFSAYMEREKVRVESRDEFGRWMCEAHNEVNRKLGKEEFDCARWEERWRMGWKDGSCD